MGRSLLLRTHVCAVRSLRPAAARAPAGVLGLATTLAACTSTPTPALVQIAATAVAVDAQTVEVRFTRPLVPGSVRVDAMRIIAPFARPIATLGLKSATGDDTLLRIATEAQQGGETYALELGPLRFRDASDADAPREIDFIGYGLAPVTIALDTAGLVAPAEVRALVTIDQASGEYVDQVHPVPLVPHGSVFTATLSARIDPRISYGARAIAGDGSEAGKLTLFTVSSSAAVRVKLAPTLPKVPEFAPPVDPSPGDGFASVRIIFDDRPAGELRRPQIRASLDDGGKFDLSMMRVDDATPVPGEPLVYEKELQVAVDPARTAKGATADTYPYVIFLVQSGEDVPERGATFTVPTESPQVIVVLIGNPALVPVRFRLDTSQAILRPDRARGRFPGEGIFLTGEFPNAEDALGRLAADAFSGGERTTLEMRERPDARGIFEKTIFLMPNRPYAWKAVRCPTGVGCAELNRHVVSSGQAFPTVMKNLVTANQDAAQNPATQLVDPAHLDQVKVAGQVEDYANAQVSLNGQESPSPAIMFKQEVPNIVVSVGTTSVATPVYVVGTWRDVNMPLKPTDIVAQGMTINLAATDYDSGTRGRVPLVRDIHIPDVPPSSGGGNATPGQPAFVATDGVLDDAATPLRASAGHQPLWVSWNQQSLYVATNPAVPGRDVFVVVSFDPPRGGMGCFWSKAGGCPASPRQVYLAMEGNGHFQGWFRRTPGGPDALLTSGATSAQGVVLEGALDLQAAGIGSPGPQIWVAALAFGTNDNDHLIPASQTPDGNGDYNLDPTELTTTALGDVRP